MMIGVGALLGLPLVLWVCANMSHKIKEWRRYRWRRVCPVCGEVFMLKSREKEVRCPGCGRKVEWRTVLDL